MFVPKPETIEELNGYYSELKENLFPVAKVEPQAKQAAENAKLFFDASELWSEMRGKVQSSEYFLLVVDGEPGSGKTNIARELAHETHKEGYAIIYSNSFDILDAPITFAKEADGAKFVTLILDDMSYMLASQPTKIQSKMKNFFTKIRHAMKAHIFMIVISHFTTGVPPLLKNSNVWIFTSPTTQEYDMMVKIVGRKQELRNDLQKTFELVKDVQQIAAVDKNLVISANNQEWRFKWGDKEDPADGRLMLLLKYGESWLYNARIINCPDCRKIGVDVNVDAGDYMEKDDDNKDAGKKGEKGPPQDDAAADAP